MRISTVQIFNIASTSMANANQAIVRTQEQLSTGKRVLEPSDDPVASTKILAISEEVANIDQYKKNIDIAKNDLSLQESTLSGVLKIIQRVQVLAVQAGNTATLSTNEYNSLSNEVDTRLDELKNLLNAQNTNGDYIFGGFKSTAEPFSGSANTGFVYNGDEGQKNIKIANNTFVSATDSGKELFVDVNSARPTINTSASSANRAEPPASISVGNIVDREAYDEFYPEDMVIQFNLDTNVLPAGKNYTITEKSTGRIIAADQPYVEGAEIIANGVSVRLIGSPASESPLEAGDTFFINSSHKQDILTTLTRFSEAMRDYDGQEDTRQVLSDTIADTLGNLKNAQTSVLEVTSQIGARFNTLESTEDLHVDANLVLKQLLSKLQDVDYAEASTRLASESLVLQAAQTAFARVSRLSLFDQL